MLSWTRTVTLVNTRVVTDEGVAGSVRFGSRVLALGERPARGDVVVDLGGAFVLPGLVNAHDHLELNHFGAIKRRERYENAIDWIDDLRPVIREDPAIRAGTSHPLGARLWVGGLKNLLAGVTTVAHHNPRYPGIDRDVPVRVVRRYGWAHSFPMEEAPVGARGEPGGNVVARCQATPRAAPFIVHAGEGTDRRACEELVRLEARGVLRPNTVVVHGVAMSSGIWTEMIARGAGLVWCPASNGFLLGRTPPVARLLALTSREVPVICLATDSRLTGSRDLLEELKVARRTSDVDGRVLLQMVTTAAARLLRLPEAGRLAVGLPADFVVVPAATGAAAADALLAADRSTLGLVTIAGRPRVGAPELGAVFAARGVPAVAGRLDGRPRLFSRALARRIARNPISEAGVQITSS